MDHQNDLCASLGHYVTTITAVYCPHEQHWLAVVLEGDDADDTIGDSRRLDWGPFDTTDDVVRRLQSELASSIRVGSRRWLAARGAGGSGPTDEPPSD